MNIDNTFDIASDITEFTWLAMKAVFDDLPDGSNVNIMIGSYGGEAFAAFSILDYLHIQKKFNVTAYIIGRAMSAAAFLAIGCDHCYMSPLGELMFHSAYVEGKKSESPDKAILDINAKQLQLLHARNSNIDESILEADTFLNASEAFELGLVDKIINSRDDVYARYIAKYKENCKMAKKVTDAKLIKAEEVVETAEEKKEELTETPAINENASVEEVLEQLVERMEQVEARLCALEEPVKAEGEDPSKDTAECGEGRQDEKTARLNALFARLTKPTAEVCKAAAKDAPRKVSKSYSKYING